MTDSRTLCIRNTNNCYRLDRRRTANRDAGNFPQALHELARCREVQLRDGTFLSHASTACHASRISAIFFCRASAFAANIGSLAEAHSVAVGIISPHIV